MTGDERTIWLLWFRTFLPWEVSFELPPPPSRQLHHLGLRSVCWLKHSSQFHSCCCTGANSAHLPAPSSKPTCQTIAHTHSVLRFRASAKEAWRGHGVRLPWPGLGEGAGWFCRHVPSGKVVILVLTPVPGFMLPADFAILTTVPSSHEWTGMRDMSPAEGLNSPPMPLCWSSQNEVLFCWRESNH